MATVAEEMKREVKQDVTSLRSALEWLASQGDVLETDVEVDPDLEITGVQKHLDGSYPILFRNVKGYPHLECVTNLFAKMDIIERLFGWDGPRDGTRKLAHAITHPIPPVEITTSPIPIAVRHAHSRRSGTSPTVSTATRSIPISASLSDK